ncbi:MAG: hypothetical protein IRF12RH_03955 [Rickettsia helvetica]|uniref:Uncharacterized protein n=2 Tax=spotted fever group TaxID=114277 RepID=A0A510GB94_9RICK|nr:hypothetical protein RAS_02780 [Rickettsia asiatica]
MSLNFTKNFGKSVLCFVTIRLDIIGVKVKATNPENKTQNAKVQANSINNFPIKPSIKPTGIKIRQQA